MNSSREKILQRLAASKHSGSERPIDTAAIRNAGADGSTDILIGKFTSALEKVGGIVIVTVAEELPTALTKVFSPNDRVYVETGTQPAGTTPAGFNAESDPARCDGAITGCDALIAETGSVMLSGGADRKRISSLVTRTHCVIAHAGQCVATLDDYFRRLAEADPAWSDRRSVLTMITGSSRTADIEKVLVLGMHGPRELVVVIVGR